ncbi:MAG: HupE/UreJ family protein [Betaproteobacteria bacterium]
MEHILTGWDHLLFVISLLLLVGINRRLVGTITAFTVAHSLTLAGSALGWLTLRAAPVEATIALSIMLVCSEALHQRETLSRRWPALVALLFGLVHGLGFAGALKEIGLPEEHAAMALLTFNLGVEAGQMLVVLGCWALATVWSRSMTSARTQTAASAFGSADGPDLTPAPALNKNRATRALVYAIGAMGAYWTISRVIAIVFGS